MNEDIADLSVTLVQRIKYLEDMRPAIFVLGMLTGAGSIALIYFVLGR